MNNRSQTPGTWESCGWAIVPAVLSAAEVGELRVEADRLWKDRILFETRGAVVNSTPRDDRLDPVIDVSEPFAALAENPRLKSLVADALGGPARLMKDKFIVKPPGSTGYGAHQDGAYWQDFGIDLARTLSTVVFLDNAGRDNGALECASGHHANLLTAPGVIADPDESQLGDFATVEACAGDVLLLHALTPHRSGPNRSPFMRRALFFSFTVDPRPDLYARLRQKAATSSASSY